MRVRHFRSFIIGNKSTSSFVHSHKPYNQVREYKIYKIALLVSEAHSLYSPIILIAIGLTQAQTEQIGTALSFQDLCRSLFHIIRLKF